MVLRDGGGGVEGLDGKVPMEDDRERSGRQVPQ